ncbi:hypothetical protein TVAG_042740 [Trichomonas vaginalis G3]|uniref:Uncharacterized protein n=1 Tax=Trichomonas vaginalis (strain ATCC PRA-98 / G3) TaxID=412133 RepID=A2FQ36_TRIV3|nr:hypothetical protein TVAGG3_1026090 [Trichomonas vaginalis G3]EAX92975.1 hypothetical protein TVAG_042740 [Trichomonas vaginalis G3]KAI5492507.1 hypothetical protein TVAGG3_1026090 [Trichomonas vaginalis G3]|eukprot:XP_001305905.1 hypothetical protein [Trichomonas vaginalis G3]
MIVKNQFNIGQYTFGFIKNEPYQLIFYDNVANGIFFSQVTEAISCNRRDKYSILSELSNKQRGEDGLYTFALVYESANKYNIWQQLNNPINKPEGYVSHTVSGYKPLDIQASLFCWGGLARSNYPYTLLDGCPGHKFWCFSIGMLATNDENRRRIPSNCDEVDSVSIWVKVSEYLIRRKSFININMSYQTNLPLINAYIASI